MAYFRNFTVSVLATIEIERAVLESRNLEELLGNYDGRVLPCVDYAYQLIMLTVSLSGSEFLLVAYKLPPAPQKGKCKITST